MIRILSLFSALIMVFQALYVLSVSASGILVKAEIPPLHTLTLDDEGRVIRIESNSSEVADIVVFKESDPGKKIELSPSVRSQYNKIMETVDTVSLGVLYKSEEKVQMTWWDSLISSIRMSIHF